MSGGEYQLVRTDSQDEESWENNSPETLSASRTRAVLDRIRALSRLTNSHKYALLSPTRLSGNPQANSSSSSFSSLLTSSTGGPKGKILLLCSFLMGLFVMSTMFWTPWDLLEDVFYVQTFLPSPSTACLLDPSSPSSYVHWNPDSNRNRNVYHCITQRIPDSPSPAFKQSSQSPSSSSSSAVGSALRTWRPLPDACLDAYYTNGSSCSDGQRTQFDIVWTWVNGSDPMIVRAKTEALARLKRLQQQLETPGIDEQAKQDKDSDHESEAVSAHLYRDHDELRHSLRSVLQYFRNSASKFVILTSDFVFPDTGGPFGFGVARASNEDVVKTKETGEFIDAYYEQSEEELLEYARLGLLPQWLQFNPPLEELGVEGEEDTMRESEGQVMGKWKDGDIPLEVVHHAEVYGDYDDTVFNSNSIESQLGNVVGDKTFIYFNDDCFFNAPLSSADFHSSAYGLVFRLVAYPWMLVRPQHYPVGSGLGEWHPMEFTNYLISKRFGARRRPYPMHQVKVLQGSLMREMWTMWDEQEKVNMGHKFRGLGGLDQVQEDRTGLEEIDPLERPRSVEVVEEVDEDLVNVKRMLKEEQSQFSKRNDITFPAGALPLPRRAVSGQKERLEKRGISPEEDEKEEEDDMQGGRPSSPLSEMGVTDDGDAHVMFLFTHFVVERSREGMLWSWIVASLGTDEDAFGPEQRDLAWRTLTEDAEAEAEAEVSAGGSKSLNVVVERRETMEPWRVGWRLSEVGDHLEAANYLFSSQDGDAYSYYDDIQGLEWWHHGSTDWPQLWNGNNFPANVTERPKWASCTIDWDVCFDPSIHRASELFKHVTFERRECGDCILKALVRASGPAGLSALLPSAERIYRQNGGDVKMKGSLPTSNRVSPHLPLTTDWRKTDFSLSAIFSSGLWDQPSGIRLREWVQRLLEKYRYVLADTENMFDVIHNPVDAEKTFANIDDHKTVALVTINDDVNKSPEDTDRRIREWLDLRWSTPAAWENPDLSSTQVTNYDSIYRKRSLAGDQR